MNDLSGSIKANARLIGAEGKAGRPLWGCSTELDVRDTPLPLIMVQLRGMPTEPLDVVDGQSWVIEN